MLYDVKCPNCGHINKDLDLYETEGSMECEACLKIVEFPRFKQARRNNAVLIPVYSMDNIPKEILDRAKPLRLMDH